MPPTLALLLTCGFVVYLFRHDIAERPNISGALWIPLIWLMLSASRPLSMWLSIVFGISSSVSLEEGSPIDRSVAVTLIFIAVCVLAKRRVSLSHLVRQHLWLTVYLAYCFLAIWWSDYSFVAFKRWIRALGDPIMVLVVLSEREPMEAISRLMKRAAYVLSPFSMMLIKYFPLIGRQYTPWGLVKNRGVAVDKNMLGRTCLILGYFLFCHLRRVKDQPKSWDQRRELAILAVLLYVTWWNLLEASSATSLIALVVAMAVAVAATSRLVNRRFIGAYILGAVATIVILDSAFGLYELGLSILEKDPTLTGRTDFWPVLLSMGTNPVFGAGFESFWLGPRLEYLWSLYWWRPNEAHNGYLEVYLNLGGVGLFLVIGLLWTAYRNSRAALLSDPAEGSERLGFLFAIVLFGWTEAAFRAPAAMFMMFYLVAMQRPVTTAAVPQPSAVRRRATGWRSQAPGFVKAAARWHHIASRRLPNRFTVPVARRP